MKQLFFALVVLAPALRLFCMDCPAFEAENSVVIFKNNCDYALCVERVHPHTDENNYVTSYVDAPITLEPTAMVTQSVGFEKFKFWISEKDSLEKCNCEESFFSLEGSFYWGTENTEFASALVTLYKSEFHANPGNLPGNHNKKTKGFISGAPTMKALYKIECIVSLSNKDFEPGEPRDSAISSDRNKRILDLRAYNYKSAPSLKAIALLKLAHLLYKKRLTSLNLQHFPSLALQHFPNELQEEILECLEKNQTNFHLKEMR